MPTPALETAAAGTLLRRLLDSWKLARGRARLSLLALGMAVPGATVPGATMPGATVPGGGTAAYGTRTAGGPSPSLATTRLTSGSSAATSSASPPSPGTVAARRTTLSSKVAAPNGSWQMVSQYPSQIGPLEAVSCPSASTCVATGYNYAMYGATISTTDSGASWSAGTLPDGTQLIGDISCGSTTTCVAVPEQYGNIPRAALIVTRNGGSTWTAATLPSAAQQIFTVSCPTASTCVAVGLLSQVGAGGVKTVSAGSVTTTDGGTTWSTHPAAIAGAAMQVVSCYSATRCVAAGMAQAGSNAVGPAGFVSTDGGSTWAAYPMPGTSSDDALSMSCPSSTTCVATGTALPAGGGTATPWIVDTANGGTSWTTSTPPSTPPGLDALTSVSCTSSTTCLAVSPGNYDTTTPIAIETTDGGSSWTSLTGFPSGAGALDGISCPTATGCTAVGAARLGQVATILQTTDGGKTWSTKAAPEGMAQLPAIGCYGTFRCTAVGYDAARTTAFIEATGDGGATWSSQTPPPSPMSLESVSCPAPSQCTAVGDDNTDSTSHAATTVNAGLTWTAGTVPTGKQSMEWVSCPSTSECFAVGSASGENQAYIYKSTDAGATWSTSTPPDVVARGGTQAPIGILIAVSCADTTHCAAVGFDSGHSVGYAVYTSDGGATWKLGSTPQGMPPLFSVSCPTATDCIAVGSTSAAEIVTTSDGGATWTAVKSPPGTSAVLGVSCSAGEYCSMVGMAGSPGSVPVAMGTTDGGRTWAGEPLPTGVVTIYSIECPPGTEVCFATGATTNDQVILEKQAPPPSITFITPDSSPLTGGASATIMGTYLLSATAATFGPAGTAPSLTVVSASEVTVTVPSYASPGVVGVTVTTPSGTSAAVGFVYVTPSLPYVPVNPFREADTRCSSSPPVLPASECQSERLPTANAALNPPAAGGSIEIQITSTTGTGPGAGAVPNNAEAVVITLTAVAPAQAHNGFLSAYPAGTAPPTTSSLNYTPAEPVPNLVTVAVGSLGKISVLSSSAGVNVIVDVEGYYAPAAPGGTYLDPLTSPVRILDTRCTTTNPPRSLPAYCTGEAIPAPNSAITAPGPGGTITIQVAGVNGIPSSGVSAVMLNVTAAGPPTANGYLTVWPAGTTRTTTSSVNFVHRTASDSVMVALGQGTGLGKIEIYNSSGTSQVIVDVSAWFSPSGYAFTPSSPFRICDTRSAAQIGGAPDAASGASRQCANSGTPVGAGTAGELAAQVIGAGSLPADAVSVTANVTVTLTTTNSYLTIYQLGTTKPDTSNLNWSPGTIKANMVLLPVAAGSGQGGQGGAVEVFNLSGTTALAIDVTGWYTALPAK